MLEGLEVSEILLSEAKSITGEIRWDSEYYQKKFLINEVMLQKRNSKNLDELCNFIKKGIFDLPPSNYIDKGIPLIRTSEIKNPTIDFSTTVYISDDVNQNNNKTILLPNDLVFTKIGAYIGDVALLPNTFSQYNFSQNVAGASIKDKNYSAFYLAFFLSDIGKNQILRSAMLSGQGKLELGDIRNYKIPFVSEEFNVQIKNIFEKREIVVNQSQTLYRKAEELLLETIGLKDFIPSQEKVNVKSFKESFLETGRLDAEYYQPKYEEIIKHIETFETERLSKIVSIKKSIEPGSDAYKTEGIPFIRVSNLSKFGLTDTDIYLDKAKFGNLDLQPKKDTILLSKDGSVGIAYKVEQDLDIITSGALLHLTVTNSDFLPDYVTLVLNSEVVKMQAERDAGGSIIQHWKPSEIEQVIIPKVPMSIQQQISALIQESFALRKESERLLVEAKEMVEKEVEK